MEQNILQQRCLPHQQEVIAFDLDPLVERKDKYLCQKCLTIQSPYRQTQLIQDAQQKFMEMKISEFNNKDKQIKLNLEKLLNIQKQIKEFLEFFTNNVAESNKILNQRIQEVMNEQNNLAQPKQEMQTEQDLLDLTNFVNYGFINNNKIQIKKNQLEFVNQILQLLDYQIFEERIQNISNQLESIHTLSSIQEQVNFIPSDKLQIDSKKLQNLRYLCSTHNSEITMICLEPKQIKQRLFCQICIKEKNQLQLKTIQDVNQLWQSNLQNIQINNQSHYDLRQGNQNKVNELIVQYQKFSQEFFNKLHKQIINQNNKIILERNESQSYILNKQLYQMELKEIEFITQTLSQHDPIQEVRQKQFQIQIEDKQYKEQIFEQLNLLSQKLMETQFQINKLFQLDLSIQKQQDDKLEQYFFEKLFPQFYQNYRKFENQYKLIIDYVKKISQIQNQKQKQNNQKESQTVNYQKILEQILQIEKIRLKQINFSINNLHINWMYEIKFSEQKEYFHKIDCKFSDKLKNPKINLSKNNKIAKTIENNSIFGVCLTDKPIPQNGTFAIEFKINLPNNSMIGICKSNAIKKDFIFDNYDSCGHGFYVLEGNGKIYSHHDSSKNNQKSGFIFDYDDIINIEANQQTKQIIWRNKSKELEYALQIQPSEDLYFCCALKNFQFQNIEVVVEIV